MKTIGLTLLPLVFAIHLRAQIWQQLDMPTTTNNIKSSSFINDQEGWIGTKNTGSYAIIYHTVDSGATWDADTIDGASEGTSYLEFVNQLEGYAVVNGEAFKTGNGGNTWTQLTLPGTPRYEPYFLNADTGFISGTLEIYKTTDGGQSWTTSSLSVAYAAYRMAFYSESNGAVCDFEGYIDGTDDGGATWYEINDGGLGSYYFSVSYTPSGSLYYAGYTDVFGDSTINIYGGATLFSSYDVGVLYDIKAFTDSCIYAVGENGDVVYTQDSGYSWFSLNLPELFGLTQKTLNVIDGFNDIYVFGEGGKGYKYVDTCVVFSDFTFSVNVTEVQFTDLSMNATAWLWDFNDGTFSTQQNPTHVFTYDGTFHVCLAAGNDSCYGFSKCSDIFICAPNSSAAVAGMLDSTYSDDGMAIHNPDTYYNYANTMAIQQDNKIVAANYAYGASILRYNYDGILDSTFSSDGMVTTSNDQFTNKIVLTPDDKILVCGILYPYDELLISKLLADGSPDLSFGNNGSATLDPSPSPNNRLYDVALTSDDKIILLNHFSYSGSYHTQVIRLNADGSPDSTFGINGIAHVVSGEFYCYNAQYGSVVVQDDGKIVLAASINNPENEFALVRLTTVGKMDTTFGAGGIVTTDFSSQEYADYIRDISLQPDGKLVAVGNSDLDAAIARYNTDGTLDSTFSDDGTLKFILNDLNTVANAVALQDDGKIMIAGNHDLQGPTGFEILLMRLNSDGTPDSSFGTGSYVTTSPYCIKSSAYDLLLDEDKIYVAAGFEYPTYELFSIIRYWNDNCTGVVADFSSSVSSLVVQFTDQSTNAISWAWDFGDGNFSSDQNPTHTYSLPGIYDVCLIAFNGCGSDTFCQTLIIIATGSASIINHDAHITTFPNPFNNDIVIEFELQQASEVTLQLTDLSGKILYTFFSANKTEGRHIKELNLQDLSAGVYLLQMKAGNQSSFQKIIKQ